MSSGCCPDAPGGWLGSGTGLSRPSEQTGASASVLSTRQLWPSGVGQDRGSVGPLPRSGALPSCRLHSPRGPAALGVGRAQASDRVRSGGVAGSGCGLVGRWLVWAAASWTKGSGAPGGVRGGGWACGRLNGWWGGGPRGTAMDRDASVRRSPGEPHLPSLFTAARNSVQADPAAVPLVTGLASYRGHCGWSPAGLPRLLPLWNPQGARRP